MRLGPHCLAVGLSPQILVALMVAESVYRDHGQEMIFTCGLDGGHKAKSLHYAANAIDLTPPSQAVADDIRLRLNKYYDVVLEATHIHVEFQPKVAVAPRS